MRLIITFNNKNWPLPTPPTPPTPVGPPNDELWYTSSDGNIVEPGAGTLPTIDSNTYVDGKGIIKCASDITSIGGNAFFNNQKITSVEIPGSVISIGNLAFNPCAQLSSLTMHNGLSTIGDNVFNGCIMENIEIPDSVISFGSGAFAGNTRLVSIIIGSGITSIGDWAFSGDTNLTSISYNGTISQWNAITKNAYWNNAVPATVVHCSDGDTPI